MPIKIESYDVAFVDGGDVVERRVQLWGVDKIRGEMESRKSGIRGMSASGTTSRGGNVGINDLGDVLARDALNLWAAAVRMGYYDKPSQEWRLNDYVGSAKVDDVDELPDPTPSAPSTGVA